MTVSIRLQGLPNEVDRLLTILDQHPEITIDRTSRPYLGSKIRRLREDSEDLRDTIQSIQTNMNTTNESLNTLSVLLADTVSLQRQGVENQQKFNELMLEDIELTAENIILRLQTQKFEAALKQQAPTPANEEREI